jgi:hypothetical protein
MSQQEWDFSIELLRAWRGMMGNRTKPYAVQVADGSYRWIARRCRLVTLADHLAGLRTVALSSLDQAGWTKWACLDVDAVDGLRFLQSLARRFADLGAPSQLESSRRGGHLWLFLAEPLPAALVRQAILGVLEWCVSDGMTLPPIELYPETGTPGALGHSMRLPLGVHQRTGQRYPLLTVAGDVLRFASPTQTVEYLLAQPRVPVSWMRYGWREAIRVRHVHQVRPISLWEQPPVPLPPVLASASPRPASSGVIHWVDANVSALDLIAEYAPEVDLRKMRNTYLGWCPFHPDQAPQEDGSPGSPSFLVLYDTRHGYGWSWRCLSSHCRLHDGPLKHSFHLLMELTGLDAASAIRLAVEKWPECDQQGGT